MRSAKILLFCCVLYAFFVIVVLTEKNTDNQIDEDYQKYNAFLNYGNKKKLIKLNDVYVEEDSFFLKSKVEVLGEIFKNYIDDFKSHDKLDLIFLIDSSSSVGENNFHSEIKFVKKLLSDITVDYNHTRIAIITYSSNESVVSLLNFQ